MDRNSEQHSTLARGLAGLLGVFVAVAEAGAAPPPPVPDVRLAKQGAGEVLSFAYLPADIQSPVRHYTIYRGRLGPSFDPDFATLGRLRHVVDPEDGDRGYSAINDVDDLGLEESYYYLVTATNADGEGSLGPGSVGPRGGIWGDPPVGAPEPYPMTWDCMPYTGAPPPPFVPPLPPAALPTPYLYPELCPPGLVPSPHEYEAPKGTPFAESGPEPPSFAVGQYWYAWAQVAPFPPFDDGAVGRLTVESPAIDRLPQTHSLAELASRAGFAFGNYVEVGWTVDRSVNNGDVAPHLFVFRWINGVPGVYNGSGWVQSSNTVVPGMKLPVRTLLPAVYLNWAGNWWCFVVTANGGGWIGYYPGSLWNGNFTDLTLVQWFGEVWANNVPPANPMGNGWKGNDFPARLPAYIDILSTVDVTTWSATYHTFPATFMTNGNYYDLLVFPQHPNGFFYYGGPGR